MHMYKLFHLILQVALLWVKNKKEYSCQHAVVGGFLVAWPRSPAREQQNKSEARLNGFFSQVLTMNRSNFCYMQKQKLLVFFFTKVKVKVAQSCLTLCHAMAYTVHEILQARLLEWVAFPFSRGSSQPRDQTQVSCIAGRFFTSWATRENPPCQVTGSIHFLIYTLFSWIRFIWSLGLGDYSPVPSSVHSSPPLLSQFRAPGTLFFLSPLHSLSHFLCFCFSVSLLLHWLKQLLNKRN